MTDAPAPEDTRRFYDATAEEVADSWYPNDVLAPTLRAFLARLPPKPRILDLGCGPGHESMRLASAGATVLGVDYSAECIRVARERCPGCRFEIMDFRGLDERFGRFDGVFAAASLIHVAPDELPDVMDRIAGVLEEGGCLLAIVLDGEGRKEHRPVVEGKRMRRTLFLYHGEDLRAAAPGFEAQGEMELADELAQQGWRAHLLRVSRRSA